LPAPPAASIAIIWLAHILRPSTQRSTMALHSPASTVAKRCTGSLVLGISSFM